MQEEKKTLVEGMKKWWLVVRTLTFIILAVPQLQPPRPCVHWAVDIKVYYSVLNLDNYEVLGTWFMYLKIVLFIH